MQGLLPRSARRTAQRFSREGRGARTSLCKEIRRRAEAVVAEGACPGVRQPFAAALSMRALDSRPKALEGRSLPDYFANPNSATCTEPSMSWNDSLRQVFAQLFSVFHT